MAYSLLTQAIAKAILTLPILFVALGYGVSCHVNTLAEPDALRTGTKLLAEITLIIKDEFDIPGEAELLACVSMTVFASIILHGIMAASLSARIAPTDG